MKDAPPKICDSAYREAYRVVTADSFESGLPKKTDPARSDSVHFSSKSCEWFTPQDFFDQMNVEYGPFDLDPCATPTNAKCAKYYTQQDDGLSKPWTGTVWMNPPYGRTIKQWMRKALDESRRGATVVCLVPARTDTAWWHDYAAHGQVRFVRGRLKFGGSQNSAPFPSAVVVFFSNGNGQAVLDKAS